MRVLSRFGLTIIVASAACDAPDEPLFPDVRTFLEAPSSRFLVDLETVADGHPFKGARADEPHSGAHVHFDNTSMRWPEGIAPDQYPAVYAVADAVVEATNTWTPIGDHVGYSVMLELASDSDGDESVGLAFTLEPFITPAEPDLYEAFLAVEPGDRVVAGDILGWMYVPPGADRDAHIHFNLLNSGRQLAPSIFSADVVAEFRDHWGDLGLDGGEQIPACMGYLLDAEENPFADVPEDCL